MKSAACILRQIEVEQRTTTWMRSLMGRLRRDVGQKTDLLRLPHPSSRVIRGDKLEGDGRG